LKGDVVIKQNHSTCFSAGTAAEKGLVPPFSAPVMHIVFRTMRFLNKIYGQFSESVLVISPLNSIVQVGEYELNELAYGFSAIQLKDWTGLSLKT